jgi:hypothetical protein
MALVATSETSRALWASVTNAIGKLCAAALTRTSETARGFTAVANTDAADRIVEKEPNRNSQRLLRPI